MRLTLHCCWPSVEEAPTIGDDDSVCTAGPKENMWTGIGSGLHSVV
jgi:hypothetical protein